MTGMRSWRGGYTLLEVLLAMAISVMLLGAVYVALDNQLRLARAGREVVEQATLARALLARMQNDIASSANLCDPARYRVQNSSTSTSGSSATTGGTGSTGTGSTPSASGGAGASAMSGGSSAGSTGSSSSSNSTTSTSSTTSSTTGSNVVTLPLGVRGDASSLHLFASKVPREVWGTQDSDTPPIVGDLRRISYWLAGSGDTQGLARQEVKVATSQDAANLPPGIDDEASYIIADEVRSVSFSYFDGTSWNDSWDSTQLGADGITPIGPPRAIAITVGIPRLGTSPTGSAAEPAIKSYRHVVAILSANGTTTNNTTGNNATGAGTTMP